MGMRWEISEDSAEKMNILSSQLNKCSDDLQRANDKMRYLVDNSPALGPHRREVAGIMAGIELVVRKSSNDTKGLAKIIKDLAIKINDIVADASIRGGN